LLTSLQAELEIRS